LGSLPLWSWWAVAAIFDLEQLLTGMRT
jgi:hypothetical protein